jgi:hypothetical protein
MGIVSSADRPSAIPGSHLPDGWGKYQDRNVEAKMELAQAASHLFEQHAKPDGAPIIVQVHQTRQSAAV